MAVIAFVQHRLGRTDGVSLEVDKWRAVLEARGHTVHYIAGNDDVPGGHFIPELYPFHPETEKIIRNATRCLRDYASGAELLAAIEAHKDVVKPKLAAMIRELGVELLIPNNLLSVGYNLPGMWALSELLHETGLPTILHSHDFWWEDSGEVEPTCPEVIALYEQHAPPTWPNIQHVVINRLSQAQLRERKGVDATVVPNVFDFDRPTWEVDAYNRGFRDAFGLRDDDLLFLQATRILDRKAVELAIDLIAEVQKPGNRARLEAQPLYNGKTFGPKSRIILLCAGYVEKIGLTASYYQNLIEKARALHVDVRWISDRVRHSRGFEDGRKLYSLWDSYTAVDFVTYPSIWEGWGNQFIEAVYAKLPVVLFEYPVWVSDLGPTGFDVVSLGSEISGHDAAGLVQVPPERLRQAAEEVLVLLQDPERRQQAVEHNFAIALEHFSLRALDRLVATLVERALR